MNKHNLQDIAALRDSASLSPPLEWLAVHKSTADAWLFTFHDIHNELLGAAIEAPEADGGFVFLKECHICGSTGYKDSKGEKVFGGHIFVAHHDGQRLNGIYLIFWCPNRAAWIYRNLLYGSEEYLEHMRQYTITIIAHIHIESEWPKEVRRLLE